jgi:DNA polymerase-3 subunit beta
MKLQTQRTNLLLPLTRVIGVVEKKQTLPILSNVLLRLEDGRLHITGTDLEVQIVSGTPIEGGEDGAVTLPGRKLLDILRLLPDNGPVSLACQGERATIRSGQSRFNLATLPVENYPAFDAGAINLEAPVASETLRQAFDKTAFAMGLQDVRYYLNGLLLDLDGNTLRTVGSDGHRLSVFAEQQAGPFPANRQVIIPRKAVLELAKLLADADDTVMLRLSPNALHVDLGAVRFATKLIEGRYPDHNRVIPRDLTRRYRTDKAVLDGAINRAKLLASEGQKAISLTVDPGADLMVLQGHNTEQEESEEQVYVQPDDGGAGVAVGFNADYLREAVSHVDAGMVSLGLTDAMNSCLVEDPEDARFRFVVMPMRL